jgi:hypothetical protein
LTLRSAGAAPCPCRWSPAPGRRAPAAPCSMGRPGPSVGVRGGPPAKRRPGIPPSRRSTGERRKRDGEARGMRAARPGSPGGRRPGVAPRCPNDPRRHPGSGRSAGSPGMCRSRLFEPPWLGLSSHLGRVRKLSGMWASSCPPGVARVSSDGNSDQPGRERATHGGEQVTIPRGCLWPTSYQTSCGEAPTLGRLCSKHLLRVQAHAGGWDCARPGCQRLSPAMRGLCAFHAAIARGECDCRGVDPGSQQLITDPYP